MEISLSRAALFALAIEISIAAAMIAVMDRKPEKPREPTPVVMLSFPTPPEPKPAEPPKKVDPPKKVEKPQPKQVHREQPKPVEKQEPKVEETTPDPKPVADPIPSAPPAPPKPQSSPPAPEVPPSFLGEVRASVQSVVRTPYAAKIAHLTGRTEVAFTYRDRQVSNPSVVVSSNYRMLDEAAIEAVNAANYPAPPKEFAGKTLRFTVWVRFYQSDTE
ncbi:MAG: TonB family protein [Burkholderiales bacterium]|nr:TonB family protein [Burkholderiales bacterium]